MKKLRFKKNVLLNNLVQHFREQQAQRAASAAAVGVEAGAAAGAEQQPQQPPQQDQGEEYDPELYAFGGSQEEGEVREPTASSTASSGAGAGAEASPPAPATGSASAPASAPAANPGPAPAAARRSHGNPMSRHIWVGNLKNGTTEQQLRHFFGQCGTVESVRIVGKAADPTVNGFLHFARTEDAVQAKERFDNSPLELPGLAPSLMKIQYQERGSHRPSNFLRVHNISPQSASLSIYVSFPVPSFFF